MLSEAEVRMGTSFLLGTLCLWIHIIGLFYNRSLVFYKRSWQCCSRV